jgi:hypothetical protein
LLAIANEMTRAAPMGAALVVNMRLLGRAF